MKKHAAARRDLIRNLKSKPCTDCGSMFHPICMDFDHTKGEKLFNITAGARRPLSVLMAEIEKCEVVCANCHRLRTLNRRKC